jgi:putative FmdB family regulatory protein
MPMYEYECGSCGRRFEQLQRITEDALTIDPECGGPVRRVIQPVGIIFKGSGFYVTDSRNASSSSKGSSNGSSDKPESKTESKSETAATKSESGPASSTESKTAAAAA